MPKHVLRQWEGRFSYLKPKRDHNGRRRYRVKDIDVVNRLKQLLWYEKLTTEGAIKRLGQEIHGEGRPQTRREAMEIVDRIEAEARRMLDILGDE